MSHLIQPNFLRPINLVSFPLTLFLLYRVNTTSNINAANTVTTVISPLLVFKDRPSLEESKIRIMIDTIECTNEDSILGDITTPSVDEVRLRAYDYFATQNRRLQHRII